MSEKELGHQVVDEDHKTQIHEEFTPSDKKETYILKATEDIFDGIIVDPTVLPKDILTFVKSLKISPEFWKSHVRTSWFVCHFVGNTFQDISETLSGVIYQCSKDTLALHLTQTLLILQNKKGVWLKLPMANSNLVQPALQVRFSETIICLCTNFEEVLIDANHWSTYSTLS
jgi:hypothetical protein